jgi:mycothiol synthase
MNQTPLSLPSDFSIGALYRTRPATPEDASAVADQLNACWIKYTGKPLMDADEIRSEWKKDTFNLATDSQLVFTPDNLLAGSATVWEQSPYVHFDTMADVHPDYEGRGIGLALCTWIEQRVCQSIPKAPEGSRVVIQQSIISTNQAAKELLTAQNYQVVRHSLDMIIEMDTLPPEPVLPDGLIIRPFIRGQEERPMVQAIQDAFQDHWGFIVRPLEDELHDWQQFMDTAPNFVPELFFVAVDGDQIAGTCFNVPIVVQPDRGWLFALGVCRPWRRRGLALAFLQHSFRALYQYGRHQVALAVDAQSLTGATRLYEKAGMHVERQFDIYEKELRPGQELSTQSL